VQKLSENIQGMYGWYHWSQYQETTKCQWFC